jgi:hypothetical protein
MSPAASSRAMRQMTSGPRTNGPSGLLRTAVEADRDVMTTKQTRRPRGAKRRQEQIVHHPSTWAPYEAPDGAVTLQEWRRSVAKAPAVHVLEVHDNLVA